MTKRLADKIAIVTGGGSGIGKSVCARLASEGAVVQVLDLDLAAAKETADEILDAGGKATAFACDVSDHDKVVAVTQAILAASDVDILVNNAGIAHVGNLENTSEADLDRLYSVNVKGVYNMLAAVVPAMKARRSGAIVNVASVASSVAVADRFAYSMTKGAVLTMTYSVAKDYVGYGIRCNCVAPGRVHTPFVDNFLAENYPDNRDEVFEQLSKSQPIGRMGNPEEIAGLIAYLCSDEAAFITGTNVPIDGGFITLNS
jgi:NAD(P)-dependent dehydrogenase (short-subunit alcohol dehydrogenase family)